MSVLKKGDVFGEMSLVGNLPRRITVRAVTHVDIYSLSKKKYGQSTASLSGYETLTCFPGPKKDLENSSIVVGSKWISILTNKKKYKNVRNIMED